MLRFWQKIGRILLFLWQLPQNLAGLAVLLWHRKQASGPIKYKDATVWSLEAFEERKYYRNVSLGRYIFTGHPLWSRHLEGIMKHEYGHCLQSKLLGWLYLPIIGVCSGLWAWWWNSDRGVDYYSFWTEKWADKWGGIER